MDAQRLKSNFAQVADHGLEVADYFYADLFERNPSYRSLFPASMAQQHKVLLAALAQIVEWVDNTDELVPYLQRLGRTHAGFGVTAGHYPEVGASLVATLKYFSGPSWTQELEKDWVAAYGVVAEVMVKAGEEA
ncbi:globin domain-containing protein [Actinomadura sp. DC4]|uniref:globin domain-containing protein n=1 Tax=Actinomadura sp. DC4 TaxID=3055069 RepID=UPI0025B0262A|nr:globin domain-containing protein [Actinomadura sp. DC4]MDN3356624.1 globin domain-containing protein [Actinomadura sp. DC4]